LARAVISPRHAAVAIALLVAVRLAVAYFLPLSADEAYYWLWSTHLAAGYYDHPPAIAFLIRGGTLLFGDTPFGVRFCPVLLSIPASWFVWRTALTLTDESRAALSAVLFNLTLMAGVEMLAATPDAPSIAASAAYVWCLARLQASGNGRWWLAAGLAAGVGLLAKFVALFLGAGTLVWLLADPRVRRWLLTPWPYLGGVIAAAVFTPNLLWQAQHHWITFAFQFGRIGNGHFTLRYLVEFFGAQAGLLTPFIFILACAGLWRASRRGDEKFLLAALVWTATAYFLFHALRDRVQGNWPCFLYPVLAILAAGAFRPDGGKTWRWISLAAAPLAALLLALLYSQALLGWLPWKNDPLPRLLGRGFAPLARSIATAGIAEAIVTTDYETTAWLRFYQPGLKVIEIDEPRRYPDAAAPGRALLQMPLIYLVEKKRIRGDLIARYFRVAELTAAMNLSTGLGPQQTYELFALAGAKTPPFGKMP
jgi:4-amino-4-deoxy-L-arabinose transferase-like glycosyltransferase